MSRRRKHGDSPGLKQTPRKGIATEEGRSVVESGKRRLRAARGSGPQGPGERAPRPLPQQEHPPVAASCSKSNPEGETWAVGSSLGLSASASEPRVGVESEIVFSFPGLLPQEFKINQSILPHDFLPRV